MNKDDKKTQTETDFDTQVNHPHEHAGVGGSYVIENGVRKLVERTKSPEEAAADAAVKPADGAAA